MIIGPSTPRQLTVIQWGWRCSHADHVCYLDDDWCCHAPTGPGHMTNHEIFGYKTLLSATSATLYLFWGCCFGDEGSTFLLYDYNFYLQFLQLRGALWCKHSKYLQTHTQVVLFAANPHQKMLLSGIFGTDWVANAWRPWKPYMLLKGRAEKTDPRSADYPTDYSADYPADYPYGLP